jgi:hypothetical protein
MILQGKAEKQKLTLIASELNLSRQTVYDVLPRGTPAGGKTGGGSGKKSDGAAQPVPSPAISSVWHNPCRY